MNTTPADLAWPSRWKAVRPNAVYNAEWGIEKAWRQRFDEFGYPLDDAEQDVDLNGQILKGRTFSVAGMVVWEPSTGVVIVGWPAA